MMPSYSQVPWAAAAAVFSTIACVQPCSARDDVQTRTTSDCPIDYQTRIGNPAGFSRFQSLSACSAYAVPTPPPAPTPSPAPSAQQPADQQPMVVRIAGVKSPGDAKKDAARGKGRRKTVVAPARTAFDSEIRKVAANYRIDPLFLHALVSAESSYKPQAVSRAGALGLMQIMPATGAELGASRTALLSPSANLDAGARHLKKLQKRYGRNFDLILSAYNAGPGAVERYGLQVPPFAETRAYVSKVMQRYGTLRAGLSMPLLGLTR